MVTLRADDTPVTVAEPIVLSHSGDHRLATAVSLVRPIKRGETYSIPNPYPAPLLRH